MKKQLKEFAGKYYNNWKGWTTNRKILVLESDDWGSIRMPSKSIFDECVRAGYPVDKRPFEKFDHLETYDDLNLLREVLVSFSDSKGNHPVFTANVIMTNPDFDQIRESHFERYVSELFTVSYIRNYQDERIFPLWEKGFSEGIFYPQYHGSEHFNISRWLSHLRAGDKSMHFAFDRKMVGVPNPENPELGNQLLIALASDSATDLQEKNDRFVEGYDLFEQVFGYQSASFIAPVYTWNDELVERLASKGVYYIQGGRYQQAPDKQTGTIRSIRHFLGERTPMGQVYLIRNVFFEPAVSAEKDLLGKTLDYINAAFRMGKPAIISTHRLNYMGGLDINNRERNLNLLGELIQVVRKKHPQLEFMNSAQLGDLIRMKQR